MSDTVEFEKTEITEEHASVAAIDAAVAAGEVAAAVEIDVKAVQSREIELRKALGMSRRQLAVELGWTESRVWYLEQEGVRLDVERNVADLKRMLTMVVLLTQAGWAKATVKATTAKTDTGATQKLVAAAVAEAVAKARAAHAEDLAVLRAKLQAMLDDAKAKSKSSKPFTELLSVIDGMQWTAE